MERDKIRKLLKIQLFLIETNESQRFWEICNTNVIKSNWGRHIYTKSYFKSDVSNVGNIIVTTKVRRGKLSFYEFRNIQVSRLNFGNISYNCIDLVEFIKLFCTVETCHL